MKKCRWLVAAVQIWLIIMLLACRAEQEEIFVTFAVDPNEAKLELFWKDDDNRPFKTIKKLRNYVESHGKELRFAMNGGMFQEDFSPLGLFIRNQTIVTPLNTKTGEGNFYLKPNGVFYLDTDQKAYLTTTEDFKYEEKIKFATQSGPMLLVNGQINPVFTPGSKSVYLRNGVCVLEDNKVIFAISRREVNFYDFAAHFKELGCQNALYLDGFVSRMYLPEQQIEDLDGDLGVIIGITK